MNVEWLLGVNIHLCFIRNGFIKQWLSDKIPKGLEIRRLTIQPV